MFYKKERAMKKQEIVSVLYDLHKITGFRMSLHDVDFSEIAAYPEDKMPLCREIHKAGGEYALCCYGDIEAFRRAKETKETYIYKCRYGLTEAVSPLYNFGVLTGFLMMGQIMDDKADKAETKNAIMRLNNPEALEALEKTCLIPSDMISSYVNIMTVCARYLTLSNALPGTRPSLTETAIAYIKENVEKRITVADLCKRAGCSKTTLITAFKRDFGKTITEVVNEEKLKEARRLLSTESALSINDIASATGFYDQSYFSKVFSAAFGMTPSTYRKESAK